jgi:hypothetical protein
MKRFHVKGFGTNIDEERQEQNFFEQANSQKREQARKMISAKYDSLGDQCNTEFRTTAELRYEFREITDFSDSMINEAMSELGYQIQFLEGKPYWKLYLKFETDR